MKLTEEMMHTACAHFDRYGGSFNRTLAQLWHIADSSNKAILMQAFKDRFLDAYEQAMDYKEWQKKQGEGESK